ncbi:MAG: hypothetical protein JOZ46_08165 [Candidatus Dormibacteraeota bacterium]|nr:hypothetical protein [Candidatus Dormibacteraeota bacterium]MBV9525773.1 hypothetical protein [Candidatus Dormibacteraeota bacterium]
MAKKTRKQKQRAAARRGAPQTPVRGPAQEPRIGDAAWPPDASTETVGAVAQAIPRDAPLDAPRRRVERLSPAAPAPPGRAPRQSRVPANAAAIFQPLESEDAAIPFDRVPYVPADLRRVAVMAVCMVVLIVIAAVIVSHVVS